MAFEDYKTKPSVVVVYTGEGKGKTSAGLGLAVRGLGHGWRVAFIQFIKHWDVAEHTFLQTIQPLYKDKLVFHKGGKGFYHAGSLSAQGVSDDEHKAEAHKTYQFALDCAKSGTYDLIVCDEINNAVNDGLLTKAQLLKLITDRAQKTSLGLTGRNFPADLLDSVDIATHMTKMKHHYDDKFLANPGIDY